MMISCSNYSYSMLSAHISFKAQIVALFLFHIKERTAGGCDVSDIERYIEG